MPPPRASGDSGRWHINCERRHKLCGDLNSQPKRPGDLIFDLFILKVVSQSRVTWATSVPDVRRQTDVRRASSLNAPAPCGA